MGELTFIAPLDGSNIPCVTTNKKFRFLLAVFLVTFSFSSLGCATKNEPKEKLSEKTVAPKEIAALKEDIKPTNETKAGEEILVDSMIDIFRMFWCGKKNTLVFTKKDGLFIYDVESRKKVRLGNPYMSPLTCSPDGEWLVYTDSTSSRYDEVDPARGIVDLWRYELKSGRHQKFLYSDSYVRYAGEGIFAPEGNTLYLDFQPSTSMEMPEPKWDVVWLKRDSKGMGWFKEPLALVGAGKYHGRSGLVEIDIISPYTKKIFLDSGFYYASFEMTDAKGRVYLRTWDDKMGNGERIIRCSIDLGKRDISCGSVFFGDLISGGYNSYSYDITDNGDFAVITQSGENCVRIRRIGESEGRCITSTDHKINREVKISPDEKWLAYETYDGLYITEFIIE